MDNFSDLAKSVLSLSSAATLFGTSQVGRLLNRRGGRTAGDRVARGFDEVVQATSRSFEGPLWTAFTRADSAQRALVDILADLTRLDPAGLLASGGPLLQPALAALNPLISTIDRANPDLAIAPRWLELNSKIEIYFLVQNAVARLGISPHERAPLREMAERAYALGPFLALWALEGIGHDYATEAMKDDPEPRGLLTGAEAEDVPAGSLLMLHAGIGLAFAQSCLGRVTGGGADVRTALIDFIRLCRDNSRPGYLGAAYESLGLVTRTFAPERLGDVDGALRQAPEDLLGYFWHGVGRAIYFAPRNFAPCAEIDWASESGSAPHEIGRRNVTAGLAWAVTLVNMRHPAVMERLLDRQGDALAAMPAFADGVRSATVLRADTSPGARLAEPFCAHRPAGPGRAAALWEPLVGRPCAEAVGDLQPRLAAVGRLDTVFRYRPPGGDGDWGAGPGAGDRDRDRAPRPRGQGP